ncbi:hypothetical protein RFA60_000221 [Vibrio parahaemolyticus]|nr:hypothetical protein [Vibrio parahaemolyticus]
MNKNKKSDFLIDYVLRLIQVIIISLFFDKMSTINDIVLSGIRNESGEMILIKSNDLMTLNMVSVICAYISKVLIYISPMLAFAIAFFQNHVKIDSTVEQEIEVKAIKNRITKIINSFDFDETQENVFLSSCNEYYKGKVQSLSEEFEQLKTDESCSLEIGKFEEMHRKFQEIQISFLNDIKHIKNIESLGYITENHKI